MKHIKSNEERHTNDSEIAVFWYEMERNLPKSLEMEALGKEKIFKAFSATYPKIKSFFLTQREADQRALVRECRNRVSNVLSQKHEGIERIDSRLVQMILYCFSEDYSNTPVDQLDTHI